MRCSCSHCVFDKVWYEGEGFALKYCPNCGDRLFNSGETLPNVFWKLVAERLAIIGIKSNDVKEIFEEFYRRLEDAKKAVEKMLECKDEG